ncbi:hypothetical protein, partial [Yersinia mollaretii]|uniref:hypothetical protein n=1 Tax=Yersinia mollaretii TaxID=33060 RepID=UPI001643B63C
MWLWVCGVVLVLVWFVFWVLVACVRVCRLVLVGLLVFVLGWLCLVGGWVLGFLVVGGFVGVWGVLVCGCGGFGVGGGGCVVGGVVVFGVVCVVLVVRVFWVVGFGWGVCGV